MSFASVLRCDFGEDCPEEGVMFLPVCVRNRALVPENVGPLFQKSLRHHLVGAAADPDEGFVFVEQAQTVEIGLVGYHPDHHRTLDGEPPTQPVGCLPQH